MVEINVMIACSALVFSFASPSWGRLSDRLGRKPVIVTGLAGYAVGNLIFALAFEVALERWITGTGLFALLLAVRCAQSLVMSGTNPGCTAYTADHSAPQYRTRALARLGTASSIGMIIGQSSPAPWLALAYCFLCTARQGSPPLLPTLSGVIFRLPPRSRLIRKPDAN